MYEHCVYIYCCPIIVYFIFYSSRATFLTSNSRAI